MSDAWTHQVWKIRGGVRYVSMRVTRCPICSAPDGFHEEGQHSGNIPAEKLREKPERQCNCGWPFASRGADQCQHPSHREFRP